MQKDKSVFLLGEDVRYCYAFGVTKGLVKEFGGDRVRDTPISEAAIIGTALGAAITGMRPLAEIYFADLLTLCMDQIVNQAAKMRYASGGQVKVPIVIMVPIGHWGSFGPDHSQSLESWFMHVPGIKIVVPSTPHDAKGLMKTAICDDNPVIFFEHKQLFRIKGSVPTEEYTIPFGEADIKREGVDVTVVATLLMMHRAISAAKELEKQGVSIEIIDPRTLVPLDKKTIINSVKKTGRIIIVEENCRTCGWGSEISSIVNEEAFDYLDSPIKRIAALDTPIPFSPPLEDYVIPDENKIIKAVKETVT